MQQECLGGVERTGIGGPDVGGDFALRGCRISTILAAGRAGVEELPHLIDPQAGVLPENLAQLPRRLLIESCNLGQARAQRRDGGLATCLSSDADACGKSRPERPFADGGMNGRSEDQRAARQHAEPRREVM